MTDPRPVRPRYGRLAVSAAAVTVTAVSVLGGLGGLAGVGEVDAQPADRSASAGAPGTPEELRPAAAPVEERRGGGPTVRMADARDRTVDESLPAASGRGRRVVFSEGRQRVWLVGSGGRVRTTYLVSGSVYDNLEPGTYAVWSRSRHATGIDDSGTMEYFVRFARGDTGAAIGFHDIPVDEGRWVQTAAQLGTAQSHGCIRQHPRDARRMWAFAPTGTKVVVTA